MTSKSPSKITIFKKELICPKCRSESCGLSKVWWHYPYEENYERAKKGYMLYSDFECDNCGHLWNYEVEELAKECFEREIDEIILNNIKLITKAYRQTVTSNNFGKKDYSKFTQEFKGYIEDQSYYFKELKSMDEDFKWKLTKYAIKFTESNMYKIDQDYDEKMTGFDYENYCCSKLKKCGWETTLTTQSSDQGVDIIATKGSISMAIQCKHLKSKVSNSAVQEIVAGLGFYSADRGAVIAPNGFTVSAIQLAKANQIILIHHSEIKDLH